MNLTRCLIAGGFAFGILAPYSSVRAAPFTWSGGATLGPQWSRDNNWAGSAAPPGDGTADLIFTGTNRLNAEADMDWSIRGMQFTNMAGSFAIQGNTLVIGAGGITNLDADVQTVHNVITLGAEQRWNAQAGHLEIEGNVNTNAKLLTVDAVIGAHLGLYGVISGSGEITKAGSGEVIMASAANTYSGDTLVNEGILRLGLTAADNSLVKVPADLTVGDGSGGSAFVRVDRHEQIANTADVTVNDDGRLTLESGIHESINRLTVNDGTVSFLSGTSELKVTSITMAGGSVGLGTEDAHVVLAGNVTVNFLSGGSPGLNAAVDFDGGTRTFNVGASTNCVITGELSNGGLTKAGAGRLRLGGSTNNLHLLATTVLAGTLTLGKSGPVSAIIGPLTITGGTVEWAASDQILDTAAVTLTVGTMNLVSFAEKLDNLTINGGTIMTGTGTLTVGGNVTCTPGTAVTPQITGNLNLGGGARTFTVANGLLASPDLTIAAVLSNGGITKAGAGLLKLSGNSPAYTGDITVNNGALFVGGNISGSITTVNSGGTLGGTGTAGPVIVANSGSLAPGESAGSLATGPLELQSGSISRFELRTAGVTGAVNDLVLVTGALTLDGTLAVTELAGFGNGMYRLFNYTGALLDNGLELQPAFLAAHPGSRIYTGMTGQVNLIVAPAGAGTPRTVSVSRNASGHEIFQFSGIPNAPHRIEANTNLVNWSTIATITAANNGTFTFTDTAAPTFPRRYYRMVFP